MNHQTHTSPSHTGQNHTGQNPGSRTVPMLTLVPSVETTGWLADSTLPRRLDVHQIETVAAELRNLANLAGPTIVDASLVEMIDLASLRSLAEVTAECDLRFIRPSVAFRATADYTGTDLGPAMPALAPLAEAA